MGSMSFTGLSSAWRVPGVAVELDDSKAGSTPTLVGPTLIMGQKTTAGTVPVATPTVCRSKAQAVTYFGEGSIGAQAAEFYFGADKGADRDVRILAIADASGAVRATGRYAIVGPASAGGELALWIGGRRVPVAVVASDTANTIATAAVTALNAAKDLPVTSAVVTTAATLKMTHNAAPGTPGKVLYVEAPARGNIATLNCDNSGSNADATVTLSDATTIAVEDNASTPTGTAVYYEKANKQLCSITSTGADLFVLTSTRLCIRIKAVSSISGMEAVYFDDDAAGATDRILVLDPGAADDTAPLVTDYLVLTARNGGTLGNSIDLRHSHYRSESAPAGLSIAAVPMAAGATDPTVTSLITAMGSTAYDVIVHPWCLTTQMNAVDAEVEDRWTPTVGVLGFAITGKTDTVSAMAAFGHGRDRRFESCASAGPYALNPPWEIAGAYAGIVAQRMRTNPAPRDCKDVVLPGIIPLAEGDGLTKSEMQTLLVDGIAPLYSDAAGVRIGKFVATYQTDEAGQESEARRNAIHAFDDMRMVRYLKSDLATTFANKRVTTDAITTAPDTVPLSAIERRVDADFLLFQSWGLVENVAAFLASRVVEKDSVVPTRVNILFPPDRANPLDQLALLLQPRLDDTV